MFKIIQATAFSKVPIKAWISQVPIEDAAIKQLQNISELPFVFKHVAVMPDVHLGNGATVGSVIATKNAIIPAAVGVDIGCGMQATRTNLTVNDLPDDLSGLRFAFEAAIPHGRTDNGGVNDRGAWGDDGLLKLTNSYKTDITKLISSLDNIVAKHPRLTKPARRALNHLGTLGTGNHFVELCKDEAGSIWIMLHSGSRGIGNAIGSYFIDKAKEEMRRFFINLPDNDLAYLPEGSVYYNDYIEALYWAQGYARLNRQIMMDAALVALATFMNRPVISDESHTAVNCHHNYVNNERHFGENVLVTRKGAVSAVAGQLGIIPGSMGAKSFIVRGKGERESFCSCSHGAGRVMSRTEARKRFTIEDHIRDTAGVECRKDSEVIDETPKAYKDIDAVMASQSDLVDIVHTLNQLICVKG